MPVQNANGIEIHYDTFGDRGGRPLVLIIGLATSMVGWPEPFCRLLAQAGHFVVRFDNRDVGRSGKIVTAGLPNLTQLSTDIWAGRVPDVPYTLADMAKDTLGLMDGLSIDQAHVCGMSMGAMIGQVMAIEHPERMASLTSLMSTTGERDLPTSTPPATKIMMMAAPNTRDGFQDYIVEMGRIFAQDSAQFDAPLQHRLAGEAFDYGLYPDGFFRQMAAIMAAGGRRRQLRQVKVPTLVLHGDHDAVIALAHGQDTAQAIPNARLAVIPGLGHGMAFPTLWPQMVAAIAAHTAAVEDAKLKSTGVCS